ncbi:DUF7691 family protein [Nocardia salmonicida]|uniref:DUF7691 family protein n=1 Tax=Nocardia salmonicida TaxID=53431 RepID=UPI0007A47BD2|nr:hypothetical protein [Nocardia salmonicida]
MGHIMHAYLVDWAELKAIIGSNNEKLLDQLHSYECERQDAQVFRAIIEGGPFDPDRAEDYVDALESICEAIGGEFIIDVGFRFSNDDFDEYELVNGLNDGSILPMAEGGGWGYRSKAACAEAFEETDDDNEYGYVDEDEDEYDDPYSVTECMRAAWEAKKDLVCFW